MVLNLLGAIVKKTLISQRKGLTGVANPEWRTLFPEAELAINVAINSDHTILMLGLVDSGLSRRGRVTFRYEAK